MAGRPMREMSRRTVFGLDVWSEEPLAYLDGARAPATGRVLDVLLDRKGLTHWPQDAELISAQAEADGTLAIRIDSHPEAGYLLSGPRYGRHVLSSDGRRLRIMPGGARPEDWQRFLVAQVLPFAAALSDLEILHASAVAFGAGALALIGASGAGKTSLALAACRLGAVLITDDVLALERREQALLAHPGTPLAGLAHAEAERLGQRLASARPLAVNERERLIETSLAPGPLPLRAVLFLDRRADGPSEPCFQALEGAGALLGATFNFVLDDPARLVRLLEVCERAARGTVRRVCLGPGVDPDHLALSVSTWFESLS